MCKRVDGFDKLVLRLANKYRVGSALRDERESRQFIRDALFILSVVPSRSTCSTANVSA
jgi:hypothetical protein